MEENKKKIIKLENYVWPDEIEKEMEQKSRKRRSMITTFALLISFFTFGVLVGSRFNESTPIAVEGQDSVQSELSKLDSIYNIMQSNWFFAPEVENIEEVLIDQALYGMTANEIDIHTSYLSREEVESFTTGIDMGFVGIGVQFTSTDGLNLITRVFHDSPADQAGVLPGDIIYRVNGELVDGMDSDAIAERVKGEEGTVVTVEFMRDNEIVELDIVRAPVQNTAYGEMLEGDVGYLQLYQFGSSTGYEAQGYLEMMSEQGMKRLIIDLRDNGGGYLETLVDIASLFLEEDVVAMQQLYSNGTSEVSKTHGGNFENIEEIVILANENSASASEVLIMTLTEQRNDVTVIGQTTYGKGTVQVTHSFGDGSALKYTTSKWLSPEGEWVDENGIDPDIDVKLHEVLYTPYSSLEDGTIYEYDSVSDTVQFVQYALDFLGYDITRQDGYFDRTTEDQLESFQREFNISNEGVVDQETLEVLSAQVTKMWALDDAYDAQLQAAIKYIAE